MSVCLHFVSSRNLQLWLFQSLLKLLHQLWLLHNCLRLLLALHVESNLLSLSTTKYLTFALLLNTLHASCTPSSYRFLAGTPIYFHFPAVTKFSRKRVDFKSAISPSSELRFSRFFFFDFGYFSARNPNLLFIYENFVQKLLDLLCKLLAQNSKL